MFNKILTILFIILFIVVIGEIGYFFYSSNKTPFSSTAKTLPTPPTSANSCNQIQRPGSTKYTLEDNLASIGNFSVKKNEKLWFVLQQDGKVKNLQFNGKINNSNFKVSFEIINSNNEKLQTYYLPDLKNVTIYNVDADGNKTITDINTLKEGDKISFVEYDDLKENIIRPINNRIEINILP